MASSYSVSTLPSYSRQEGMELIGKTVLTNTFERLATKYGIEPKWFVDLNGLTVQIPLYDDESVFETQNCALTSLTGQSSFLQRTLTLAKIKVEKFFCDSDISGKYVQFMRKNTANTDVPYQEFIMNEQAAKVAKNLEAMIFEGNTTSSDPNLNKINGLYTILSGTTATDVVTPATITGVTITASNVLTTIETIIANIPSDIALADDLVIFVSPQVYNMMAQKLTSTGLYQSVAAANDARTMTMVYPNSNVIVIGTGGLASTAMSNMVICTRLSNIIFGTNLKDEVSARAEGFYDQVNDKYITRILFVIGVQIARTAYCVTNF